jgi:hypothetical protein
MLPIEVLPVLFVPVDLHLGFILTDLGSIWNLLQVWLYKRHEVLVPLLSFYFFLQFLLDFFFFFVGFLLVGNDHVSELLSIVDVRLWRIDDFLVIVLDWLWRRAGGMSVELRVPGVSVKIKWGWPCRMELEFALGQLLLNPNLLGFIIRNVLHWHSIPAVD